MTVPAYLPPPDPLPAPDPAMLGSSCPFGGNTIDANGSGRTHHNTDHEIEEMP